LYEAERQAEWAEKWKMALLTAGAGGKSTPIGAKTGRTAYHLPKRANGSQ